jgi:penicillin-binding protein 1A
MTADEAYLTTSLMRGVVEFGTAARAKSLGRPVAGKTGTTNKAKDAWFVGYSTELVASVWVGYDDPLPLGWGESGAVTALPAWVSFMKAAHTGRPVTDFPRPSGVVVASVDPATGLLPYPGQTDAIEEEFLDGTVPTEVAAADAGVPEPVDAGADAAPDDEAQESRLETPTPSLPEVSPAPSDAGAAPEPDPENAPPPF